MFSLRAKFLMLVVASPIEGHSVNKFDHLVKTSKLLNLLHNHILEDLFGREKERKKETNIETNIVNEKNVQV